MLLKIPKVSQMSKLEQAIADLTCASQHFLSTTAVLQVGPDMTSVKHSNVNENGNSQMLDQSVHVKFHSDFLASLCPHICIDDMQYCKALLHCTRVALILQYPADLNANSHKFLKDLQYPLFWYVS